MYLALKSLNFAAKQKMSRHRGTGVKNYVKKVSRIIWMAPEKVFLFSSLYNSENDHYKLEKLLTVQTTKTILIKFFFCFKSVKEGLYIMVFEDL